MRKALFLIATLGVVVLLFKVTRQPVASGSDTPKERPPFGLEKRVPWTTSRLTGSPEAPPPYKNERVFPALKFKEPVTLLKGPIKDRLFLLELRGSVYSFSEHNETEKADLALNLADIPGFWRAYGLTFHPKFTANRQVFLCYVLKEGNPKGSRVSRFTMTDADPPKIDLTSEKVLLEWPSGGHNGGSIQFGPDGYLYISTGDGSNPSPPDSKNTGQDISDLLSSVLRIDVDRKEEGKNYRIPDDNPFVKHEEARPEVWAYGFRNPWKMSFDDRTGDLWVGDVGWEMVEMVYRVERGGNYGWSITEGRQTVRPETKRGPTPILPPTMEHDHSESRSLTGGRVYYGSRLKGLQGSYVYGDYVTGKLWGLRFDGKKVTGLQHLADSHLEVIDFGEGKEGELYVLDYGGTIHRLVPNTSARANADFPRKLSATGLFASTRDHTPAAGVIPYAINAEPWADHATAERLIALPVTTPLSVYEKQNLQIGHVKGEWIYPSDTVFAKTLSLEMERGNPASRRRLETQVLHRDGDTWRAYNYLWNDDQTDAVLAGPHGLDRAFTIKDSASPGGRRQQTWHFAGRTECQVCHTTRAGSILGFNIPQLNREQVYGKGTSDQLRTLEHIKFFAEPLDKSPPKMPDPFDTREKLNDRARAYLHTNCAHCHRRGGGGTAPFELLYQPPLEKLFLVGTKPSQGTCGIPGAENIAAGNPYRSVLYYRMAKLGRGRMPYSGSNVVDQKGLDLIHNWIAELPATSSVAREDPQAEWKTLTSSTTKESERKEALTRLLATPDAALFLLRAMDTQPLPESTRVTILASAAAHPDGQVRDLFERFVPEEQRIKRLGSVIKPETILALRGDEVRGQRLFFNGQGVQCKSCHRIDREGGDVGPDLSLIGKKYNRVQLLESLLEPSKFIDAAFVTYLVETRRGTAYTGLLVKKSDTEVVLKDAQGKVVTLPMKEVESLSPSRTSLMPELLLRDLTAQEVADLLAYLGSKR